MAGCGSKLSTVQRCQGDLAKTIPRIDFKFCIGVGVQVFRVRLTCM